MSRKEIVVNGRKVSVDNVGNVYTQRKMLKPSKDKVGYMSVLIGRKRFLIHRLVAKAFIENYSEEKQVHHIDFDKSNNAVENLVCLSTLEHQKLHKQIYPPTKKCEICGKEYMPNKTKRKISKTCSYECWRQATIINASTRKKPINQYDLQGKLIKKWQSMADIEKDTGYYASNINKCCNNHIKTYKGYVWKYS